MRVFTGFRSEGIGNFIGELFESGGSSGDGVVEVYFQ